MGAVAFLVMKADLPYWARASLIVLATAAVCLPVGAMLHRYVFHRKEVPLGYRWRKVTYTFSFDKDDRRRQQQDMAVEIEARRNNLSLFANRYKWSGQGSGSDISLLSDAQILLDDPRMNSEGWRTYYVHLLQPILRNERATIRIRQTFYDEGGTFDSHLSKFVREDVDVLVLRVVFPSDMPAEDKFRPVERKGFRGKILSRLSMDYDSATASVTVNVKSPQKGRTYGIEWAWNYP
ncbi:hypothetical protein ACF090_17130 [Streptomyces sp. NPDC014892]|uniref:hypothetical protein n=1 Tax=Streptomyces sp. NPDC014892 TaxID=3364930 RepID=UPI003701697A